jgi:hypothetical protein
MGDGKSTTTDQQADDQAGAGGHANRFPRVLMHEFVGGMAGGLGFGDRHFLQMGQLGPGLLDAALHPAPQFGRALTGLIGRHAQQFLGIGNDKPQIAHQLVLLGSGQFSHEIPPSIVEYAIATIAKSRGKFHDKDQMAFNVLALCRAMNNLLKLNS